MSAPLEALRAKWAREAAERREHETAAELSADQREQALAELRAEPDDDVPFKGGER